MSRRRAPRPAAAAFRSALGVAAPRTPLAATQAAWQKVVGSQLAEAATPVAERGGEVTVECADPVWAEELAMMQASLLERLRGELGEDSPKALKFRARRSGS